MTDQDIIQLLRKPRTTNEIAARLKTPVDSMAQRLANLASQGLARKCESRSGMQIWEGGRHDPVFMTRRSASLNAAHAAKKRAGDANVERVLGIIDGQMGTIELMRQTGLSKAYLGRILNALLATGRIRRRGTPSRAIWERT